MLLKKFLPNLHSQVQNLQQRIQQKEIIEEITEECGNGIVENDEECDDGEENSDTNLMLASNCLLPDCGDGVLDPSNEEEYDDNNAQNFDGCSESCTIETGMYESEPNDDVYMAQGFPKMG